jgi:CRISPR-associated protein Csb2
VTHVLLISIRLHDGRYHGAGDWPPAPARLFQALVAGAACNGTLAESDAAALRWLEGLSPPVIAAPAMRPGMDLLNYVPNNDLDAVGGHPRRVGELRVGKTIRPLLLDPATSLIYAWTVAGTEAHLPVLTAITARLYQLGRGVDMACAAAELADASAAEARLAAHPDPIYRPGGGEGRALACPQPGSLDSLIRRHEAQATRFRPGPRKGAILFVQPPKPQFRRVMYDCPPTRLLFELRAGAAFAPWPQRRAVALVELLRDEAARRLCRARPDQAAVIERLLIGRGAAPADIALRPRLIALPSIGFEHADRAIRRVLLEVPPGCPLAAPELRAALLGIPLDVDRETGEVRSEACLVPTLETAMLRHYGIDTGARRWRSVTPMALPGPAPGPARNGSARLSGDSVRAGAVLRALRHAGITTEAGVVVMQREPFHPRGELAASFAAGTRFATAMLRHVELCFPEPLHGPLVLGNGRWLGLELFAPMTDPARVLAFDITEGLVAEAAPTLTSALRRAVMARVRDHTGSERLAPYFTGHAPGGEVLRGGNHAHLAFAYDQTRLLVIPPHVLEARPATPREREHLATLGAALAGLAELRAGTAGLLRLRAADPDLEDDRLLATATCWRSVTPYVVTRHAKAGSAAEAVAQDVRAECRRRNWPEPVCEVTEIHSIRHGGLGATVTLRFATARPGPILLGRTAHEGGGLFRACR